MNTDNEGPDISIPSTRQPSGKPQIVYMCLCLYIYITILIYVYICLCALTYMSNDMNYYI
jgi:hypothetical protein